MSDQKQTSQYTSDQFDLQGVYASCARCGGASGFHLTETQNRTFHYGWGLSDESQDDAYQLKITKAVCIDCGVKINLGLQEKAGDLQ